MIEMDDVDAPGGGAQFASERGAAPPGQGEPAERVEIAGQARQRADMRHVGRHPARNAARRVALHGRPVAPAPHLDRDVAGQVADGFEQAARGAAIPALDIEDEDPERHARTS